MDWEVRRVEGLGVTRVSARFARYRNFVGGEAWFSIGSIPVHHVNYGQTQKEPAARLPSTTNLGILFPSHRALSYGLTSRTWRGFAQ